MRAPEQTYLDGMAPPSVRTPELDARIAAWLTSKDEQKHALEAKKNAEHALLVDVLAAQIDRYPYTDAKGKLRYFVPDTTARAKSIAAVSRKDKPKRKGRRGRHKDVEIRDEIGEEVTPTDDKVEVSRGRRTKEHDAIVDPFAATRQAMAAEKTSEVQMTLSIDQARELASMLRRAAK